MDWIVREKWWEHTLRLGKSLWWSLFSIGISAIVILSIRWVTIAWSIVWRADINENIRPPSHPASHWPPLLVPTCANPLRPIPLMSVISAEWKFIQHTLLPRSVSGITPLLWSVFACFFAALEDLNSILQIHIKLLHSLRRRIVHFCPTNTLACQWNTFKLPAQLTIVGNFTRFVVLQIVVLQSLNSCIAVGTLLKRHWCPEMCDCKGWKRYDSTPMCCERLMHRSNEWVYVFTLRLGMQWVNDERTRGQKNEQRCDTLVTNYFWKILRHLLSALNHPLTYLQPIEGARSFHSLFLFPWLTAWALLDLTD